MNVEGTVVTGVVSLLVVTVVVSGPLVGAVDLTTEPERPSFGDGTVTVTDVSLPSSAELTKPRFGAGRYYLRVPPAVLQIERVIGNPRLVYFLEIEALGYKRSTAHAVSSEHEGQLSLTLGEDSLPASDVDRSSYDARIAVEHWSNGTARVLASRNVTVEVGE